MNKKEEEMARFINIFLKKENIELKIKDEANITEILTELQEKLPELKKFYKEERTPILVTGKMLKNPEMDEIQKLIQGEIKVDIEFDSPKVLGLHGIKKTFKKDVSISEAKFYRGSLRSGQRLEFEGSIVIIGDVNDGAEVIAEDNIVILGNLRGMAHAGAKGNEKAIIAANLIESSQIRIASAIKERTREEMNLEKFSYACIGENDQVVME